MGGFWGAGNPGGWFLWVSGVYVLGNLLALLRQDTGPLRTAASHQPCPPHTMLPHGQMCTGL